MARKRLDTPAMNVAGSKGYDIDAEALVLRYERVQPAEKCRAALHLMPTTPCRVLDIGPGSGVDAAWFASLGHEVVAVEPTAQLGLRGLALHPSPRIRWIDDYLPHLLSVIALGQCFDFIVVAGVWTHLDPMERDDSMRTLASLIAPGGVAVMSLRHGTAPVGRLTFPVTAQETVESAESCGLLTALNAEVESQQDANRMAGVTWNWLVFERQSPRRA